MSNKIRASLRRLLTIPYVALLLLTAALIGFLSYSAGRNAVDSLSNTVLSETTSRIAQAVDRHIAGSEAVLETAFPKDLAPPLSIEDDIDELRLRLWLATSIHRDPSNYAYYGDRNGQFIGLYRFSENEAELRLRIDDESLRSIYRYSRINGKLENPVTEKRMFEPRNRPWYKAGQGTQSQTWTSVYIDFKTLELVSTRVRRVNDANGKFEGVVATDVSLQLLNDFLTELRLTPNGFAFIVEPDGNLIAISRGPHIRKGIGEDNARLNASDSADALFAPTYQSVMKLTGENRNGTDVKTSSFRGPDGAIVQTGYARLVDDAGLDWIVAVAVPRDDFMHVVIRNVRRTVVLALLASLMIGFIGWTVLNVITRDLRQLANAARDVGEGVLDIRIPINRKDEIGDLARAFSTMQQRLQTDRLTGIPNREAVIRRIEDRIIHQRRSTDSRPFAILFVDLNGFKSINDRMGHNAGDQALIDIGQKLQTSLRAQDMAGRYGGDEFIVLLDDVSNRDAANAARDKLRTLLSESLQSIIGQQLSESELVAGAAIGVALCPDDGNDLHTLIKQADEDMYQNKRVQPRR